MTFEHDLSFPAFAPTPDWISWKLDWAGDRLDFLGATDASGLDRNQHYLSDEGINELLQMLDSGCYRIDIPEEGALMVVAYLVRIGKPAEASRLLSEFAPMMPWCRFYPVKRDLPPLKRMMPENRLQQLLLWGDCDLRDENIAEPAARHLYKAISDAFLRLPVRKVPPFRKQTLLSDYPWVQALERALLNEHRGQAIKFLKAFVWDEIRLCRGRDFEPVIINTFQALSAKHGLSLPLVQPLTHEDINAGSVNWETYEAAARVAGMYLRETLYERHYRIKYATMEDAFDFCRILAARPAHPVRFETDDVRFNTLQKYASIWTTDNLAVLWNFAGVHLPNIELRELALLCFAESQRLLERGDLDQRMRIRNARLAKVAWRHMVFFLALLTKRLPIRKELEFLFELL